MNEPAKRYYKHTDIDGDVFSLIERGSTIVVTERSKADDRISSREIDSFNTNNFLGPVTEITKEEYKKILNSDWMGRPEEEDEKTDVVSAKAVPLAREPKEEPAVEPAADSSDESAVDEAVAADDEGAVEPSPASDGETVEPEAAEEVSEEEETV